MNTRINVVRTWINGVHTRINVVCTSLIMWILGLMLFVHGLTVSILVLTSVLGLTLFSLPAGRIFSDQTQWQSLYFIVPFYFDTLCFVIQTPNLTPRLAVSWLYFVLVSVFPGQTRIIFPCEGVWTDSATLQPTWAPSGPPAATCCYLLTQVDTRGAEKAGGAVIESISFKLADLTDRVAEG